MHIPNTNIKYDDGSLPKFFFEKLSKESLPDSYLYQEFPLYRGEISSDTIKAEFLLVSKSIGVIIFRCIAHIEENDVSYVLNQLGDLERRIFSKLITKEGLSRNTRELRFECNTFVITINKETGDKFVNIHDFNRWFSDYQRKITTYEYDFDLLISVIEGSENVPKKKERRLLDNGIETKGKILGKIEAGLTLFDNEQRKIITSNFYGPLRIRGLAGSGKTIVLAMKAALYHLEFPNHKILYTFQTKSLTKQISSLIGKYYYQFSENREPDWDRIDVIHAWGGYNLPGVYYNVCVQNDIHRVQFEEAKSINSKNPFSVICEDAIQHPIRAKYDLTIIDEGQDFDKYFYRLCLKLTKNKNIIWAYDDFQNIFDIEIQDEKETFGVDENDNYEIDFSHLELRSSDIALQVCYRTSRFALVTAFCFGLGIYYDKIIQTLDSVDHWKDLGFDIKEGDCSIGSRMKIIRPEQNSSKIANEYFNESSVMISSFNNYAEEIDAVCKLIYENINEEELNPDDICIIILDENYYSSYINLIIESLNNFGIKSFNLINAPQITTVFSIRNHVTITSVNKAKGNEAGMVYIVGIDYVFRFPSDIIRRNKLFTAITRSKGWVYLSGVKIEDTALLEFNRLKDEKFAFEFVQPDPEETRLHNRTAHDLDSVRNQFSDLVKFFAEKQNISFEDAYQLITGKGH